MKNCPYCAEEIQDAAVVCKHCGRDLKVGASQVQIVQAKPKTGIAAWGCLTLIVLAVVGWLVSVVSPTPSAPARPAATATPAAATPQSSTPPPPKTVTPEDMKRERTGRFGSHTVSALEQDGQLAVTFDPPLPRDDRTVIDGAEYSLREFLKVDTRNGKWRPNGKFLRVITAGGIYDVLLLKNNDNTVHSFGIVKR